MASCSQGMEGHKAIKTSVFIDHVHTEKVVSGLWLDVLGK